MTGVICYSVLQSGLLTGSFRLSELPESDWRARGPDYNVGAGAEFAASRCARTWRWPKR